MFEKIRDSIVTKCIFVLIIFVAVGFLVVRSGDDNNTKAQYDGLVVTDSADKSYMLEHSGGQKFRVVEFDVVNMRAKRN